MPTNFPLSGKTRPRILIRAARLAQRKYNRKKMLMRWLLTGPELPSEEALQDFTQMEDEINTLRVEQSFDYRVQDHVELLAAVIFEAAKVSSNQPNASGSEAFRSAI